MTEEDAKNTWCAQEPGRKCWASKCMAWRFERKPVRSDYLGEVAGKPAPDGLIRGAKGVQETIIDGWCGWIGEKGRS